MLFSNEKSLPSSKVKTMSPRILAHLGDAVFHLYEREREIMLAQTASQVHQRAAQRTSAASQAELLEQISDRLTEPEADIVRRARNVKPLRQRRNDQATYRHATAFEALLGYLYLTDRIRLQEVLELTIG